MLSRLLRLWIGGQSSSSVLVHVCSWSAHCCVSYASSSPGPYHRMLACLRQKMSGCILVAQDCYSDLFALAKPAEPKDSFGKTGRTGLKRCLLCRLLSLGQLQHHSQASKLRVIVGRGNNSSGGEASLPRVVESHLLQRNMNYITGQGVITVYLRGLRH